MRRSEMKEPGIHGPRRGPALAAGLLLALALCACGGERRAAPSPETGRPPTPGGDLVVAIRAEPNTLNPTQPAQNPAFTVMRRLHDDLIRINRATQETEPGLAESWQVSDGGRRFTLELRPGLTFSDGEPMDVEDVLFSLRVYLDPEVGSPKRDLLVFEGEPIRARALDPLTVEFELAAPAAAGDRLFDDLPILPRHLLEGPYREGRLPEVWGPATPPAEIAGMGPFRLREYAPGERIVLERNPHFWKEDEAGVRLPYLDTLTFLFVPSEDAQTIRFQAGEIDVVDRITAENFDLLERRQDAGGYRLLDLGPDLTFNFLFFNLNDLSGRDLPRVARSQGWFRRTAFRQAVSAAIDRDALVRLVYGGRATPLGSFVSPGNRKWVHPDLAAAPRSPEKARAVLEEAGFSWGADGRLLDPDGAAVEFTLITSASNTKRVRMMTIIQEDLREIGMQVQAVPLEFRTMMQRIFDSLDYEACVLTFGGGDADPNPMMNILRSGGGSHLWNLGRSEPGTPWEAEIDRLMEAQLVELDAERRRRLYFQVQEIMARELPLVPLVSPNLLVGARAGLGNFRPAILEHWTLWNAEELFWQ